MKFKCATITERDGKAVNAQLVESDPKAGGGMRIDLVSIDASLAPMLKPNSLYEITIAAAK